MSTTKHPVVLLTFSIYLLFALANAQSITSFEFGEVQNLVLSRNETAYYKFSFKEIKPNYDLSIVAQPRGDGDPELFVSTTEHHPNAKENSEYYSTSYGYSSIYIPQSEIKVDTDYYLGATCASETCDFTLIADYAQEYYMRPFVEHADIDYVHGGSLVARVFIPDLPEAAHILFAAETENLNEVDQGLHLYANAGNEIPTSDKHDIFGSVAWKDGKAAYVYRGDAHFCTNCNYTVVVEAPKKSKITLRRMVYGPQIPMTMNSERMDAIENPYKVTYAVNISQFIGSLNAIEVEVLPYYGTPYVYINQDELPSNLSDYKYSMIGRGQEGIAIPIERIPGNSTLYITVFGYTHSTYTIKVSALGKDKRFLALGEPQVGYVVGPNVSNFLVVADGRKDMKMTFSLHPEQGKVDLFVKTCQDKNDCSFTNDEVKKILSGATQTSKKIPILQFSNVTDGDELITIEMDGTVCDLSSGSSSPKCYFAVGVQGTISGTSKFSVSANRAGLHQALRASTPVRDHLTLDQYQYYYITIGNDTGIDSVNFQVTKISGDVTVYISRTARYPDLQDREKPHHYNDFYSFERQQFQNLSGTYYIAVKARTSATYSIVPIIKYNTNSSSIAGHTMVQLAEGIPQKIVLDNEDAAYFKFDVYFEQKATQGLEISLNEVQGSFDISVTNNGEIPVKGNPKQWTTTSNTLILTPDDERYLNFATYFVGVFPKNTKSQEDSAKTPKAQSFSITWSALNNFRTISFGIPFYNWVSNNKTLFYKFEVHPSEDKEIVIHKNVDTSVNNTIDMYLANLETKLGHDVSAFNADRTTKTKTTSSDTIKLNSTDIAQLCGNSGGAKCYLYLALVTNTKDDVPLVLTLTKDFDDLRLSESVETYYSFPSKDHPIHLYYYPHQLEDITILAHTWGRNMTLYGKVIDTKEHSSRQDWVFPSSKKYDYMSKDSVSHRGESRLYIPAGELAACGADYDKFRCGVAIALYYETPEEEASPFHTHGYIEYGMFSIIANQEITPIVAGKPVHTSVNEGSYRYFSLFVNKEEANLLISASVLSGRHIVILATKGKDARPTLGTAEFRSYYGKMETLQVGVEQTDQGTAKGYWVIAVYGYSSSEFVLNVVFEKDKMLELHRGLPVNVDANDDPVFFEYYHESNYSFQFKLTKERGVGTIAIKSYKENQPVGGNLPTATHGDIIRQFDHVQSVIDIFNRSAVFCSGCLYVVGVFPQTEMKVSVVVQLPGQFIYLQDNMIFTDYATNAIQNKYEHIAWTNEIVDINMVVYSGEPHIYIAHNPLVNSTNSIWSYNETASKNYIRMRLDNTKYVDGMQPLWDGTRNVSQSPGMYYILVTAPIPSNYSIAVSISNSTRSLIDGHLDFGFLNSGEFNLYKYHVSKDDANDNSTNRLKLQFTLHRDEFFSTDVELQEPSIIVMAVPSNKSTPVPINPDTMMPDLAPLPTLRKDVMEKAYGDQHYTMNLHYEAAADQDFYIIVNNTSPDEHLNYSIVANSHEPLLLAMNNLHASRLAIDDSDVYSVHVGHSGLLVIEIHNCIGKVMVQSSRSKHFKAAPVRYEYIYPAEGQDTIDDESFSPREGDDFTTSINSQIPSSMGEHITLASVNVEEEGTYYIIVTAYDGIRDDDNFRDIEAVYKIRANLYPLRSFQPFTSLQPGNDGQVEWDIPSSGKLNLDFADVKNLAFVDKVRSTKYGDLSIEYYYELFLTKSADAGLYLARCDMLPNSGGRFKGMDRYQKKLVFTGSNMTNSVFEAMNKHIEVDTDPDFKKLYATIRITAVGVDGSGNHIWDYPLIYKTAEAKAVEAPSHDVIGLLLAMTMIMLTLALGGMMYYYEKFKRVKAKLNYEMQDLKNMGTIVESFETLDDSNNKKGGYAGLIEEKDVL